jgi:hypothetical protein
MIARWWVEREKDRIVIYRDYEGQVQAVLILSLVVAEYLAKMILELVK